MTSDAENWGASDEFEEAWKEYAEIVEEKMLAAEELDVVEKAELSKEEVRKDAGVRIDLAKSAVARIFEKAKKLPEKERESIIKSAERIMVRAERVEKRVRPVLPEPIEAVEDACAPEHAAADTPEPKADDEQTHQGQAAEMTPRKRAAIIKSLGRRYPALESALNRGEAWAKECRVPKESSPDGKQGWYYLERIEDQCRARYGATAPAPVVDLSPAGQLHRIGK